MPLIGSSPALFTALAGGPLRPLVWSGMALSPAVSGRPYYDDPITNDSIEKLVAAILAELERDAVAGQTDQAGKFEQVGLFIAGVTNRTISAVIAVAAARKMRYQSRRTILVNKRVHPPHVETEVTH